MSEIAARQLEQVLPLATLANRANSAHRAAERTACAALEHARQAGVALIEAKEQVPHGDWGDWLRDHFEGSARTAQMYMRVAGNWGELEVNPQRVADLSLRQAVRLLEKPRAAYLENDPYGLQAMEAVVALLASVANDSELETFADAAEGARYWSDVADVATRCVNHAAYIQVRNLERMAVTMEVTT